MTARRRTLVTLADRLVVYVLVGTALVLLLTGGGGGEGAAVRITGDDFERVVSFGEGGRIEVEGPLGVTVVELAGGTARVVSSPCPHRLCVKMGAVSAPGRSVVCVPNRVAVTVVGEGPASTDAVTR
ncbi:MAG TPA: NusG domain II-containing protein [bacterium]|nr:NusG domain II-containing protein [bacterium]